jgi:YbbR domain-containing protein
MRQFPPARIVARNLAAGRQASFEPPTVSLSLRGAAGALARVEAGTLSPYVDAEGLLPGRYELSVQLDLAGTLTLGSARPATVTVTIR